MHKYGCTLGFSGIHVKLVKSGIQHARRGLHVGGSEAIALVGLLQYAESLQFNVKASIKDDADWLQRFMPLAEISSALKLSREQVRLLERKLMEGLIKKEPNETSSLEVGNIDGRWCIKSGADLQRNFESLLLSSGSGAESIVEPLSAVPLNDELQQARASVSKAEDNVLVKITEKINARATYSLSFGGTCPDLFIPDDKTMEGLSGDEATMASHPTQMKWKLYLPKLFILYFFNGIGRFCRKP